MMKVTILVVVMSATCVVLFGAANSDAGGTVEEAVQTASTLALESALFRGEFDGYFFQNKVSEAKEYVDFYLERRSIRSRLSACA